jgi:uncharacterized protein YndB with AHSA1/START domain
MIFIAAPAEKVWALLTDRERSPAYFFGHRVEIEPRAGGVFTLRKPDGAVDSEGEVLAFDPPHHLTLTWKVVWLEAMRDIPAGRVDYRIEPMGEVVRVTVSEFFGAPLEDKWVEAGRNGWAMILSGVKTMHETGKPLPAPQPEAPK